MKYRCSDCGRIVYSREGMTSCPNCDSGLEDVTPEAKNLTCPVSGGSVRQINGIPDCDHFKLANSVGSRCTLEDVPGQCKSCGLPFYTPRVGLTTGRSIE